MRTNWARLALVNVLILLALLVLIEAVARLGWTAYSCFGGGCNFSRISSLELNTSSSASENIGLSRFDSELGYVPAEGFDAIIDADGWDRKRVTITQEGFRANGPMQVVSESRILALGDSFTFGDQVSNDETWPACLERKLGVRVDNGGVFGYGAAQSLKRGAELTTANRYSAVVLSVLVDSDFERDGMMYRSGFPRPAVILDNQKLGWAEVSDPKEPGTKYNPASNPLLLSAYRHSLVLSELLDKLNINPAGNTLARIHPQAASKEQIIAWTLAQFAGLNADKKVLLLQYARKLDKDSVRQERKLILESAAANHVQVVDTYDSLAGKDPARYWNGHHTPLGNQLVCEVLAASM